MQNPCLAAPTTKMFVSFLELIAYNFWTSRKRKTILGNTIKKT